MYVSLCGGWGWGGGGGREFLYISYTASTLFLLNFRDFRDFKKIAKFNTREIKIARNLIPYHITKQ